MRTLNISIFVDVVALFAGAAHRNCVYLYDDAESGSVGKGTAALVSAVHPGQLVRWALNPLDVQTQIWLSSIRFDLPETHGRTGPVDVTHAAPEARAATAPGPIWARVYEGYAPCCMSPGIAHRYSPYMAFGTPAGATFRIDGPALVYRTGPAPHADAGHSEAF